MPCPRPTTRTPRSVRWRMRSAAGSRPGPSSVGWMFRFTIGCLMWSAAWTRTPRRGPRGPPRWTPTGPRWRPRTRPSRWSTEREPLRPRHGHHQPLLPPAPGRHGPGGDRPPSPRGGGHRDHRGRILRRLARTVRKARKPHETADAFAGLAEAAAVFGSFSIMPFPVPAIQRFDALKKLKLNAGPNDLRIAAIALEAGATVVTRNLRDFRR